MIHGSCFIRVRSETQLEIPNKDWSTTAVLDWEEEKNESKGKEKGGYLQNFEILETLESVARNVPQLISRDSPRKETQRPKEREREKNNKFRYMITYELAFSTHVLCVS